MTNTLNTPVEVLERHYPLRIIQYAQRRGSGGAGEYRGGDGVVREYEFLADAVLSILSERRRHGPWGLEGGGEGFPGGNSLDGEPLGGKCQLSVRAGQVLRIETPGGGGYGLPNHDIEGVRAHFRAGPHSSHGWKRKMESDPGSAI